MRKYYVAIAIVNLVVLASIVAGFIVGGSPTELKDMGYDATRMSAFTQISYRAQTYYALNHSLPASLASVIPETTLKDPQSGKPYVYTNQNGATYDLCAIFSTDSEAIKQKYHDATAMYQTGNANNTTHKKGYDCISYNASPTTSNTPPQTNTPSEPAQRLLENSAIFSLKDTTITAMPKDTKSIQDGGTTSGNIKLLIRPALSNLYNIQDNPTEYLVSLYAIVMYDGDYTAFKNRCWNKSATNIPGCHYNLQDVSFVSATGVSLRKNFEGAADYTKSKVYPSLPNYGDFTQGNKNSFAGVLTFYVPKLAFTDNGNATKFYVRNFNKGQDSIAQPKDIEVSIVIK